MQLSEIVKRIEQELAEAKSAVNEKQAHYKECVTLEATLEKTINDHANNRDRRLKDLEKKIKAVKTKMQSASKDLKARFLCFSVFCLRRAKLLWFINFCL